MLKYEIRMDIIEKLLKPTTSNNFVKSALVLLIPVFKKGSMASFWIAPSSQKNNTRKKVFEQGRCDNKAI